MGKRMKYKDNFILYFQVNGLKNENNSPDFFLEQKFARKIKLSEKFSRKKISWNKSLTKSFGEKLLGKNNSKNILGNFFLKIKFREKIIGKKFSEKNFSKKVFGINLSGKILKKSIRKKIS